MFFPSHYKKNRLVPIPKEYLNGQGLGNLADMRYGFRTIAACGCGVLAVYNAMIYKKLDPDFAKIARYTELTAAPLGALCGTFPFSMKRVLRHFGVDNKMTRSMKKLNSAKAGVVAFWTKYPFLSGGHYFFYVKGEDGKITIYNRYSNRDRAYVVDRLEEEIPKHCLIVGNIIL